MSDLEPPESHHVSAAVGWIELGLPLEAERELARLSPETRDRPEILALHWDVLARLRRWTDALGVAGRLLDGFPTLPTGWINRSYTLHELQRTVEARDALLPAVPLFPTIGVIPYNLACYECQLGHPDQALTWLRQAISLEGREVILERAADDSDLAPLRDRLTDL